MSSDTSRLTRPGESIEDIDGHGKLTIQESIDTQELKQLMDLKKLVNDIRSGGRVEFIKAGFSNDDANQIYLDALQTLLLNLRTYAEQKEEYWTGTDNAKIGAVKIYPPEHPSQVSYGWRNAKESALDVSEIADSYADLKPRTVYTINGLLDVLQAPNSFTTQFAFRGEAFSQQMVWVAEKKQSVPRHLIDTAVEWTFTFMNSIGIDLDISKSERDVQAEVI